MKNHIIRTILCILSFCIAFGIPQSEAMALSFIFKPPIIVGSLNKRLVQHIVRLHQKEIRHCYEVSLLKDKTLNGSVTTQFIILPDGSVESARVIDSTLNNPELEQCMIDHIKNWKFYAIPNFDGITVVNYPFTFVSNYKQPKVLEHTTIILNADEMKIEYYEAEPATDNQ